MEAVFGGALAVFEEFGLLGFDRGEIVGVDPLPPEVGVLQVFVGAVAEKPLDVAAHENRRKVVLGLEAVDHGRRGIEQPGEPFLHRCLEIVQTPSRALLAFAGCLIENRLDDVGDRPWFSTCPWKPEASRPVRPRPVALLLKRS